jgi:hypothetical protein
MMSDIIYPAGAVDDYVDGVYKPYRATDDANFHIDVPMLALPGNHDWYDGLAGFMFHFCRKEKLPAAAYARPKLSPIAQLFRILWRRPPGPRARTRTARDTIGVGPTSRPYFAIKTRDVLLVVDTGIDGTIDDAQWAWLRSRPSQAQRSWSREAARSMRVRACWVGPAPKSPHETGRPRLARPVGNPAYNYVATIGDDVHNYQRHVADPATDPAGAHPHCRRRGWCIHARDPQLLLVNDSRLVANLHVLPHAQPDESDPTPARLNHFAKLLIPAAADRVQRGALHRRRAGRRWLALFARRSSGPLRWLVRADRADHVADPSRPQPATSGRAVTAPWSPSVLCVGARLWSSHTGLIRATSSSTCWSGSLPPATTFC